MSSRPDCGKRVADKIGLEKLVYTQNSCLLFCTFRRRKWPKKPSWFHCLLSNISRPWWSVKLMQVFFNLGKAFKMWHHCQHLITVQYLLRSTKLTKAFQQYTQEAMQHVNK